MFPREDATTLARPPPIRGARLYPPPSSPPALLRNARAPTSTRSTGFVPYGFVLVRVRGEEPRGAHAAVEREGALHGS